MDKNNPTENEIKNVVVETYAEDMARVIEDDKTGLVKKIIHEEEQHEIEKINLSPESTKNKFFMLISLIFIVAGLSILIYFIINREVVPTVPVQKQFTPLVFSDKSSFFEIKDLKKDEIIQTVLNAVSETKVKKEGVEGIYLTIDKQVVGLRKFMVLIGANFDPKTDMSVSDSAVSDNFLMGSVNGETKDFFILIKVSSIADVFTAMRDWEKKMFTELSPLFGFKVSNETKSLANLKFEDGIIENKNARILYVPDEEGKKKIIMMYIFVNDNSILIANTESAASELMLRLATSKVKK